MRGIAQFVPCAQLGPCRATPLPPRRCQPQERAPKIVRRHLPDASCQQTPLVYHAPNIFAVERGHWIFTDHISVGAKYVEEGEGSGRRFAFGSVLHHHHGRLELVHFEYFSRAYFLRQG